MNRSLLDYRPEIEAFESPEALADRHASGNEMQRAAELLEHLETGELEGYLVELIDRAAPRAACNAGTGPFTGPRSTTSAPTQRFTFNRPGRPRLRDRARRAQCRRP